MVEYANAIPTMYQAICLIHKLLYSIGNNLFVEYMETILIINNKSIGIRILNSTLYLDIFFKLSHP